MKEFKMSLATWAAAGLSIFAAPQVYSAETAVAGPRLPAASAVQISSMNVGGSIVLDQLISSGHSRDKFPSSAQIRKARMALKGDLSPEWSYVFKYDFAKGDELSKGLSEVSLGYTGIPGVYMWVGQAGPEAFLSNTASSSKSVSLELPAIVSLFSPEDGLGLGFSYTTENNMRLAVSAVQPVHSRVSSAIKKSDRWSFAGRLAYLPVCEDAQVIHMGTSAYRYENAATNKVGGITAPTPMFGRGWDTSLLEGGSGPEWENKNINKNVYKSAGVELATVYGPMSMQAEYLRASQRYITSKNPSEITYKPKGGYVNVAYVLSGESRQYDKDSFTVAGVQPATEGGAWEAFAQYDGLDLRHKEEGGRQQVSSFGMHWYANKALRVSGQYSHVIRRSNSAAGRKTADMFGLRLQASL